MARNVIRPGQWIAPFVLVGALVVALHDAGAVTNTVPASDRAWGHLDASSRAQPCIVERARVRGEQPDTTGDDLER